MIQYGTNEKDRESNASHLFMPPLRKEDVTVETAWALLLVLQVVQFMNPFPRPHSIPHSCFQPCATALWHCTEALNIPR